MKTNIKHGIIFGSDYLIQVRGQAAILANNESNLICAFLKNGITNVVALDGNVDIIWNLSNKRNKLFLEYDQYSRIIPLSVETDGTETIRSGRKFPPTASNGSMFYNIEENCIYIRLNGVWQEKSVVLIGEVLGMTTSSQKIGSQTATSYEIDSGVPLYCQFGSPIANSSSCQTYDDIDILETPTVNYIVLPVPTMLPTFTCVRYTNTTIELPSNKRLPNGVLICKNRHNSLIATRLEISNVSMALETGPVFCSSSGKLRSTPNKEFFCYVGEYDSNTKKLKIDMKEQEYIL